MWSTWLGDSNTWINVHYNSGDNFFFTFVCLHIPDDPSHSWWSPPISHCWITEVTDRLHTSAESFGWAEQLSTIRRTKWLFLAIINQPFHLDICAFFCCWCMKLEVAELWCSVDLYSYQCHPYWLRPMLQWCNPWLFFTATQFLLIVSGYHLADRL